MKKQAKKLIILAVLLVCAVGLYFGATYLAQKEEEESAALAEETITAASFEQESVNAVNWTNSNGTFGIYKVTEDDSSQWKYLTDKALPLDQSIPSQLLSACQSITAINEVAENPEDLDQYGLTSDAITVTFEMEDGSVNTYYFGSSSHDDGIYFKSSSSSMVYTVSFDSLSLFEGDEYSLVEKDSIPSYTNIEKITVIKLVKDEESGDEKEEKAVITASVSDDTTTYSCKKGDEKTELSEEEASSLESSLSSLSFDGCVNYKGEKEEYGLKAPAYKITVTGKNSDEEESESYTLYLGSSAPGSSFYAYLKGSKKIFTITQESVADLINY